MAKITLAKALKTKNRIASRISQVRKLMAQHNAYVVDKDIPVDEIKIQVDVKSLDSSLEALTKSLVDVKAAISKGNAGSAAKIFELSEVKGLISWYESLDCQEGKVNDPYGYSRNATSSNDVKRVQISLSERNEKVKNLVLRAETLQDELDEYNATQRVDVDDSVLTL